jgi:small subunit ribosomal protein S16
MLKIRLQRQGRKRIPAYKIVLAEHTMPVRGRFLEKLGHFIGTDKKGTLVFDAEKIRYWISKGASVSETVARMLLKEGIQEMEKFVPQRKQVPNKKELKAK